MAEGKLYLRPIGFLYGPPAEAAIEDGLALPLAGGPIAFTAAVVIEGDPTNSQRRLVSVEALEESRDADLGAVLERVTAPRTPFAGLSLARPTLMGIVNVTPDSFSDGGLYDET
jgi:dihydropteroate synthase